MKVEMLYIMKLLLNINTQVFVVKDGRGGSPYA